MSPKEKQRFNRQYKKHLQALKLQGKAASTIDVYSRAVRRLVARFDRCPDRLTWSSFLVHKVKRFLQSICSSFKLVWTPVPQIRM